MDHVRPWSSLRTAGDGVRQAQRGGNPWPLARR